MLLIIYNMIYGLGWLLYLPFLIFGKRRSWQYVRGRFVPPQFLAPKSRARVWLHSVSVGETNIAINIAKRLIETADVVISTSTPTGFENLRKKISDKRIRFFYTPWDFLMVTNKFVRTIEPDVFLVIETEFWPSLFYSVSRNCEVYVVNARISTEAFIRYKKVSSLLKCLVFGFVRGFLCQDELAMERLKALGVESSKLTVSGNIKFDIWLEEKRLSVFENLRERFLIVLGSTHNGEEEQLFSALRESWQPNWLVVCAPRHPERADQIVDLAEKMGWRCVRYSTIADKSSVELGEVDVVVVDVIGILAYVYRYADVVFIGGSLVNKGGQNPLEALYWGKPVFFGPYMQNFDSIVKQLICQKAAVMVSRPCEFALSLRQNNWADTGKNVGAVFEKNRGSTDKVLELVCDVLNRKKLTVVGKGG